MGPKRNVADDDDDEVTDDDGMAKVNISSRRTRPRLLLQPPPPPRGGGERYTFELQFARSYRRLPVIIINKNNKDNHFEVGGGGGSRDEDVDEEGSDIEYAIGRTPRQDKTKILPRNTSSPRVSERWMYIFPILDESRPTAPVRRTTMHARKKRIPLSRIVISFPSSVCIKYNIQ